MRKILSDWSKKVKKAMIDRDMDTNDLARQMKWTRQYTSSLVNGCVYQKESVAKISLFFGFDVPSENTTLARTRSERAVNE